MQKDMFLLKEDQNGPLYARAAALATARVIPPGLRQPDRRDGEVEIYYVSGLRDWIKESDWERIKPLLVMEEAESDLRVALDVALRNGMALARMLEQAQARIRELEAVQSTVTTSDQPHEVSEATSESALRSDMTEIMLQPVDTPPPPHLPAPPKADGPVSSAIPLHKVVRVKRTTFYSTTTRENRAQWSCFTDDGRTVNLFDHSDPLRDHKPMLEKAGYLAFFQLMKSGETVYWQTNPILVAIKASGRFWDLVSIEPRAAEALPDDPPQANHLTSEQLAVCREAKALLEKDPIIFDCETTGLADDDEVVQFAGVKSTGSILFCELVQPTDLGKLRRPGKNRKTSVDIHGIDEDMLKDAHRIGDEAGQMGWICTTYLHGKVWAAFNIDYDVRLLRQSWTLDGCLPETFPVVRETVCVQQLMNRYIGHDFTSMDEACRVLGIPRGQTHRADADARDTAAIIRALAAKVPTDELKEAEHDRQA